MADPIADIIGGYRAFAAQQHEGLLARGIDISPYPLSHLAVRVAEWDQYVHIRTLLERHAIANRENLWNGRPISLIVPSDPLEVLDGQLREGRGPTIGRRRSRLSDAVMRARISPAGRGSRAPA